MPPPAKVNANANSKEKATSMLQQEVTAEQQELKRPRHSTQFEVKVEEKVLPDHLAEGLDMIVVGINPGYSSALAGHHYAGPGNHFWKCLYLSGLVSRPMTAKDDANLLEECRIGFTNMVARTTRSSANLKRQELQAGALLLRAKLTRYRPLIAVFNGKGWSGALEEGCPFIAHTTHSVSFSFILFHSLSFYLLPSLSQLHFYHTVYSVSSLPHSLFIFR